MSEDITHSKYELYMSKQEYAILQEQVEIGLEMAVENEEYQRIGLLYTVKLELECRAI